MLERRFTNHVEVRASGDEGAMVISGYAARWGVLSQNLGNVRNGNFREMLSPGCFQRSLATDRQVACLFNHDPSAILGTKRSGTLAVSEDAHGLKFRCNVANTTTGREVYHLIQRRDIQDCSFAFEIDGPDGDSWSECDDPDTGERIALRTVSRAKLYDISQVLAPAYENATDVVAEDDTGDDNEDDDLFLNSMPRAMRDYFPAQFPTSMPMELRSRIITANVKQSSRAREARQRLLNICLS